MRMPHNVQLAAILSIALVAWGQTAANVDRSGAHVVWGPPNSEWRDTQPPPTFPREMARSLAVDGWPIVLEQTKLESAQRHFGGTIGSRGDASEALGWLCLYRLDKDASWVLWLESSEIDGPSIGGFRLQQLGADARFDRGCRQLRGEHASVILPMGLHLGMSEADVVAKLGKPSGRRSDTAIYVHEHDLTVHHEPYTLSNDLLIVYRNGRIWAIQADHTTVS
jgi:hypothetical protein